MLKRAIDCFESQSYRNKQLVVLFEDHDLRTAEFLQYRELSSRIKLVCVPGSPKKTLGELRNIAVGAADGQYVCQWDDDDWYHMDRLSYQYSVIASNNVSGSILSRWIVFDGQGKRAFVSNRRRWEGSVMCKKEVFTLREYESKTKGEDTDVVEYLYENNHLVCIEDKPFLYVYIYHGGNTWNLDHFSGIFNASQELFDHSSMINDILDCKYEAIESAGLLNEIPLTFSLA